jgi:hypothetical protein
MLHQKKFKIDYNWTNFTLILIFLRNEKKKVSLLLVKRSKLILLICFQYFYLITIGCLIGSTLTMALNYNIYDFFLHGISWIIIWTLWCYFAAYTAYWPPGYFCITCYYLKLRLNSVKIRLKVFILRANRLSVKERSLILKSILNEQNLLCQQINSFNKYWKKYLTTKLILFVLIMFFVVFNIY